ncbi:unnamed protein product [Peronospora belbahrii]|uniref:Uncharacterized protein n=1 Tax=Peronospora belbahrii TaxID=622444 RepID=A0AAU9LBP9_9STRA|nr:unnamed protein product [Peronospora belbahrii]
MSSLSNFHVTTPPWTPASESFNSSDSPPSSNSENDSDYLPDSRTRLERQMKKAKKQTTQKRQEKGRKTSRKQDQLSMESDMDSEILTVHEKVVMSATKRPENDRKVATWADDGNVDQYRRRVRELRQEFQHSVTENRKTFYNSPRPSFDDKVNVTEHDERETENQVEKMGQDQFYSPWDVIETTSGLLVPTYVMHQLLPHQRECLEWLHKLHERGVGGILGDDMGLGKTVQLAAFFRITPSCKKIANCVVVMSSVSVIAVGTGVNTSSSSECYERLIEEVFCFQDEASDAEVADSGYREIQEEVPTGGGVIITTYENVRQYQSLFLTREWDYVVLDEGHRIRNPDAGTTLACKQLRTIHRIILSGTPIQNRLRELWSLFDFVYPGRLGTLPTFDDEFVLPIRAGGYATATKMQVMMAYKCALALKDLIQPFFLRRTKQEILAHGASGEMGALLPGKQEQIIFCRLTARQRTLYKRFLASPEIASVLRRDIRPFRAISVLRHICNHPDLLASFGDGRLADKKRQTYEDEEDSDERYTDIAGLLDDPEDEKIDESNEPFGAVSASGKMVVLRKVLTIWKKQGHRVLIFTQTRCMLDILESFMASVGHTCTRLDGTMGVAERQKRLDAFNAPDSKLFAFLLTTRAGGIGVNLVGADRVVVFDPDWNPSTDLQARERAWRIGQQKPVTVYRFVTAGTIEEKIYHRQIFKQYLSSKVLHDAKRKRCFNKHSLRDLFVLADEEGEGEGVAETNELFIAGNVDRPAERDDSEKEDEESGQQSGNSKSNKDDGDNDVVLRQLFDGGDVRGVFDHSAVESHGVQNQEADLVEIEATKIAQGALIALRASGALVRQQRETIYTPTWTGRSGAAGDPCQRHEPNGSVRGRTTLRGRGRGRGSGKSGRNGGLSSRDMLARIKQRRDGIANPTNQVHVRPHSRASDLCHASNSVSLNASDMAKRLHSFLIANETKGVTTERLLNHFGHVIGPKDKLVFRHVLRDMAICRGRCWTLKSSYATTIDS